MSEKRFVDYFDKDHNYIIQDLQNEDEYQVGFVNCDEDVFLELVNKIADENEQLKSKNRGLQSELQIFKEDVTHSNLQINKLADENEQLKQFQDRVFSWIDMHLQRLPTLRDDEFESDNEFADPSLYSGAIQILETMKRELKGDVE